MKAPILYIVIPCYNEEKVLPITAPWTMTAMPALVKAETEGIKMPCLRV